MAPARARIFWAKAERFRAAAASAARQDAWDAVVSAAIHASISMVDAICVRHLAKRCASENHDDTIALLLSIESLPRGELETVAKHHRGLLALKHWAECDDRLCTQAESRRALQAADRIATAARAWLE